MRYAFHLSLALVVAVAVGFALSYLALERGMIYGTMRVGPWVAWYDVGVPNPDPYTNAYMARSGGLYLTKSEGITFVARNDTSGAQLTRACSYRVDGLTPSAAFWTLTATDENGTLVARAGSSVSMHSQRLSRASDGSAVIRVGDMLASGNWLETAGEGPFQLVLTIYDSILFSDLGSNDGTLPSITQERCH